MKVAGITFHDSSNYGAALQTYALQQAVTALGHSYVILDYSNAEKAKFDSLLGRNRELGLGQYLYKLASYPYNSLRHGKFWEFSDRYLNVTPRRYRSFSDLQADVHRYDRFVCGSDQVWNTQMTRFDPAYFLAFVPDRQRKFSYAASFGRSELTEEDEVFYRRQLAGLDRISVRERTGQYIVERLTGKHAQLVLDPVLLLTRREWEKISSDRVPERPYILVYAQSHSEGMQRFVQRLKRETGLAVMGISRSPVSVVREKTLLVPSPRDFIALFANARFVVTNSFHGTAFSLAFNRDFFSFLYDPNASSTNSRIVDFLELTFLRERLITAESEPDLSPIDFAVANEVIAEQRRLSTDYLRRALE